MIQTPRILTPGPSPVLPAAVQAALSASWPGTYHRSPEFRRMLLDLRAGMKVFLKTANPVVMLTCSGTGAMEACAANALSPGDHALVVAGGRFGDRWGAIARGLGVEVTEFSVTPGESPDPELLAQALIDGADRYRAVMVCAVETSTGTLTDLTALGEVVKGLPDCLLIVDGITWAGCHTINPDALGIDMLVTSSQKALAAPPGVAMVSLSPDAVARAESNQRGCYMFDLIRELETQQDGLTAFTPAITAVAALLESLKWINGLPKGVGTLIRNAEVLSTACRRGLEAIDCEVFPKSPANSLTVVRPPEGISSSSLIRDLRASFGWQIADGRAPLKGKIMRIGHMGYTDIADLLGLLGALELVMIRNGVEVRPGRAVTAAQESIARAWAVDGGSTP